MAQRQHIGHKMQFSIDKPLFFILLYKLALLFIHAAGTSVRAHFKTCAVGGIQTASCESQLYRKEDSRVIPS